MALALKFTVSQAATIEVVIAPSHRWAQAQGRVQALSPKKEGADSARPRPSGAR